MIQEVRIASAVRLRHRILRVLYTFSIGTLLVFMGFAGGVAAMWLRGPELRGIVYRVMPSLAELSRATERPREQRLLELTSEVWPILEKEYLHPGALDENKMIYGAMAGLVGTLGDRHTVFVEPVAQRTIDEDMQGSFEGIGATVTLTNSRVTIVRPLPNSPALRAGLRAGDVILAVDDASLEGKTLQQAIALIRGPKGTVVRLRVQREGTAEPFIVPVTRDRVESPIVESALRDDGLAYLRLTEFNARSYDRVHRALIELLGQNPTGLIFDLRGNPGGYLQMAIDIASDLLPRGALIVSEQERDRPLKENRVERVGVATEIPLVVLVNKGSASASEIVAGAIRDNRRGTLIGEETFGKGSVQNTHKLHDGSGLRVTISKWLLPSGQNLDGAGIAPEIKVPLTPDDLAAGRDPQLERAVSYLLERG